MSNVERHENPAQRSVILEVRKSRWDPTKDPATEEFTVFTPQDGHNNSDVRLQDCHLEWMFLDDDGNPDAGGESAQFLFLIDGERSIEVSDPTLEVSGNRLGEAVSPNAQFGMRVWQEDRHSLVPGR